MDYVRFHFDDNFYIYIYEIWTNEKLHEKKNEAYGKYSK